MHDGYLFTLGISASASVVSPAPKLLDVMLAALPPVKRAALLGEVLPLDNRGLPHDPLLAPITRDMHDAEVLLIVTPLWPVALPTRLATLLDHARPSAQSGALRGKVALLVGIAASVDKAELLALARLQDFCAEAGIVIADTLVVTEEQAADNATAEALQALARRAYGQARQLVPDALP